MNVNPEVSKAITSDSDRRRNIGYTALIIIFFMGAATVSVNEVITTLKERIIVLESELKQSRQDYKTLFDDYKMEVAPRIQMRDSLIMRNYEVINKLTNEAP